ncbi:MAG TPA: PaaI family thioesterase [Pseudomonadales bacterium]|nr:PaaI family thioesterase [Pseudomonadales bacterium]
MSAEPRATAEQINAFLAGEWPESRQRCHAVGTDWAEVRLVTDRDQLRPGGIVSGPTLFGLCDAALWFALFAAVGIEPMALTSELSIRYLRPARGDAVLARATLDHVGRRSVIGTIRCFMEDAPQITVAAAQGTYVRPRS